ncbi:MAG: Uma2 family endonuclease [Blautia sp.]
MSLPKTITYTLKDIYALPDGERAELIDGHLYSMAPQNRIHQKILMELCFILNNYVKVQQGSCEVYPAPFAVFIGKDDKNYVEPDISVICDKNKLTDKGCHGAPDFIIEIVSPSSRKMDYTTKNALYSDFGVREYWIVDPVKERTTVYRYEEDAAPMIVPFSVPITVGIYQDLVITIAELLD